MILSARLKGYNYLKELKNFITTNGPIDKELLAWLHTHYTRNIYRGRVDISSFNSLLMTMGDGECMHDLRYVKHVMLENRVFKYVPLTNEVPILVKEEDCDVTCPANSKTFRRHYLLTWYKYNPAIYRDYKSGNALAIPNGYEADMLSLIHI